MRISILLILSLILMACEGEETVPVPEEETPPNETNPSTLVVEIEEPISPCDQIEEARKGSKPDCPDLEEHE